MGVRGDYFTNTDLLIGTSPLRWCTRLREGQVYARKEPVVHPSMPGLSHPCFHPGKADARYSVVVPYSRACEEFLANLKFSILTKPLHKTHIHRVVYNRPVPFVFGCYSTTYLLVLLIYTLQQTNYSISGPVPRPAPRPLAAPRLPPRAIPRPSRPPRPRPKWSIGNPGRAPGCTGRNWGPASGSSGWFTGKAPGMSS